MGFGWEDRGIEMGVSGFNGRDCGGAIGEECSYVHPRRSHCGLFAQPMEEKVWWCDRAVVSREFAGERGIRKVVCAW